MMTSAMSRVAPVWGAVTLGVLLVPGGVLAHGIGGSARDKSVLEFVPLGIEHMLLGWDHLLFIAGVVLLAGELGRAAKLISLSDAASVHGAFVFEFIVPYKPHLPNPCHDLDMSGYGIVKVFPGAPADLLQWEPKAAFAEVARIYANPTIRVEITAGPRSR